MEDNTVITKTRKKANKKQLDSLFNDDSEIPPDNTYYKDKLRVYVLSGQIKELYGKIVTEHELNNLSEQECGNIYKICELNTAKRISDSVIDGIVTVVGNLCAKILPIENKDKYITDLKSDYIINSELKNVAGNITMRTGKLMSVLSFIIHTASNISYYSKGDKELDKGSQEFEQELDKELQK